MQATYTAYEASGETVKAGTVTYSEGPTEDDTTMNFLESVVQDVGEDLFEGMVFGIRVVFGIRD